ncbi:MAG: hypothetical protein RIS10_43, partial [Pseudomonadota bacterium]
FGCSPAGRLGNQQWFIGGWHSLATRVGESPSWLRHWILIPACEGSNPSSPAILETDHL